MLDDPIIYILLISLLAAASEWIGRRRRARQASDAEEEDIGEEAPAERRNFREKQQEWEKRLRRLLEGDVEAIRPEEPPTPPPSLPQHRQPPPAAKPIPAPMLVQRPAMRKVASAQKKPDSSGKIRKIQRKLPQGPAVSIGRFQNRNALRQAVIASVVLGPSKATEENPDLLRF